MNEKAPENSQQMKEKINAFRQRAFAKTHKKAPVSTSLNVIITIFSDLLAGLLVGAGVGYLLYSVFDMHLSVLGIFVLLGGLAGFLNLYKSLKRLEATIK